MKLECRTIGKKAPRVYVVDADNDDFPYADFEDLHDAIESIRLVRRLVKAGLLVSAPSDLLAVLEAVLVWFDKTYPPGIFTGVSKDSGVLEVVELREQARAALAGGDK